MITRKSTLPITRQARLLGLARSTVYYRPATAASERDLALMAAIDLIHTELPSSAQEGSGASSSTAALPSGAVAWPP